MSGKKAKQGEALYADVRLEEHVLGAMMCYEEYAALIPRLTEEHFSVRPNVMVFGAIRELYRSGVRPSLYSVAEMLLSTGKLEPCGGMEYLTMLHETGSQAVRHESTVNSYYKQLCKYADRRYMAAALSEAESKLHTSDPSEIASDLVTKMAALSSRNGHGTKSLHSVSSVIEECGGLEGLIKPADSGITIPWELIQRLTGKLTPGSMWIIAGRPGAGKSTMALQMSVQAALNGHRVSFISLEMPPRELTIKAINFLAGFDSRKEMHSKERRLKTIQAAQSLNDAPILFWDSKYSDPTMVLSEIESRPDQKPEVLVVDYIQLMRLKGSKYNRNEELTAISAILKIMASKHNIAIVSLSQLSRSPEKSGREPDLHDLRDSGSLEQDADVVIILSAGKKDMNPRPARAIVAKNRYGPTGYVKLLLHGAASCFTEEVFVV